MEETLVQIPIADTSGHVWQMPARICRPKNAIDAPLAIINHGSTSNPAERKWIQPESCDSDVARWFVAHGFAVVFALRLGYGDTHSPFTEEYRCEGRTGLDFYPVGLEGARQIREIVEWSRKLPHVIPEKMVVVGHSGGGWATIAYNSLPHPHVVALINMAGGRGGHWHNQPNSNCHPERLIAAVARYGKNASTPMLWVYALNDTYFPAHLAADLNKAYVDAAGRTQFEQLPNFDNEGHSLFGTEDDSKIWGSLVESYLGAQHVLPNPSR